MRLPRMDEGGPGPKNERPLGVAGVVAILAACGVLVLVMGSLFG